MKSIYREHLKQISQYKTDAEKLNFLNATLRSLLQVVSITCLEVITELTPIDEFDISEYAKRLCSPSDGLPIQIIDDTLPYLRTNIKRDFLNGWFEAEDDELPLFNELTNWVEFRNKRPAHGVVDKSIESEWATKTHLLITRSIKILALLIPTIDEENNIKLSSTLSNLSIATPLVRDNHAVVITKIISQKGIWKITGQVLSRERASEFKVELPDKNIFSTQQVSNDIYTIDNITIKNKEYSFFHNIPIRQTDTFEGRKNELDKLINWLQDIDSSACLIFGDGGIGKTTFVLEFLNKIKDNLLIFEGTIPSIISYHSAKKTRWIEGEVKYLSTASTAMGENIRELMRLFINPLGKEWYTLDNRRLIDKAAGVLAQNKYSKNEVLLIFDNTETLATRNEDIEDLGDFFTMIGRKIGRIIITSRRREFTEARPINVKGLSEIESITLMKRLSREYVAKPIKQASDSNLKKVCNQLAFKPLLIDALVKYVSRSGIGIQAALDNIFKKSNEELLEFLYEDAWLRMTQPQKDVFLILVLISCPLDKNAVSKSCQEIGIQYDEFNSSLDETYFASIVNYGSNYTLEIVDLAERFFLQKYAKYTNKEELQKKSKNVDVYSQERERINQEFKRDRVTEAFKSDFAKQAKIYVDNGSIKKAIEMYELAIEDDPINSALHDRFAWILMNRVQDYEYAEFILNKSIELDKNNCDALVNLALVYYRTEKYVDGDNYIEKANKKGRSKAFCLLQKGISRYYQAKKLLDIIEMIEKFIVALNFLEEASKALQLNFNDSYYNKNKEGIQRFIKLTKYELQNKRREYTKSH